MSRWENTTEEVVREGMTHHQVRNPNRLSMQNRLKNIPSAINNKSINVRRELRKYGATSKELDHSKGYAGLPSFASWGQVLLKGQRDGASDVEHSGGNRLARSVASL